MGPGQNFLTRFGSGQFFCGLGWVAIYGLGLNLENFPLKMSNLSTFFHLCQKNLFESGRKVPGSKAGRPLIYCRSKVSSGLVGSGPISSLFPLGAYKDCRINVSLCLWGSPDFRQETCSPQGWCIQSSDRRVVGPIWVAIPRFFCGRTFRKRVKLEGLTSLQWTCKWFFWILLKRNLLWFA